MFCLTGLAVGSASRRGQQAIDVPVQVVLLHHVYLDY